MGLGILTGHLAPAVWVGALAVSGALLFLYAFCPRTRLVLIGPLVFLTGLIHYQMNRAALSPHDLRAIVGETQTWVTIRGTLTDSPQVRVASSPRPNGPYERTLATVEAQFLRKGTSAWIPAVGQVFISTPGALPACFNRGTIVEIEGVLSRPPGPAAPGLFDFRAYLAFQGIQYQLQDVTTNDWRCVAPASTSFGRAWMDRFMAWAKANLAQGLPEEDQSLRLVWAMALGWRTALTSEVAEPFMRSGTMHIFAISGLHVMLIGTVLVALMRVLGCPRSGCVWVVIPALWFYVAATGWQASALRSTIMMCIILAGWSIRRPSDLINSLSAAALILLTWDPGQLFQAGFQLSFGVVLSLALCEPVLRRLRDRLLAPDGFLPGTLVPPWKRWMRARLYWVSAGAVTSAAAWLGSLPMMAYYFHYFNPISLLANVVVVPLTYPVLASCLGSLLTGAWFPSCAILFNHCAWFYMYLMIEISDFMAGLPLAWWHVGTPSTALILFYYAAQIGVMVGGFRRLRWRRWLLAFLGVLAILLCLEWHRYLTTVEITLLPLNGGGSVFVRAPRFGQDLLVDGGNAASAQAVTKPYLRSRGCDRLPILLLTHGDARHVGGVPVLFDLFPPVRVYASGADAKSGSYQDALFQAEYRGVLKTIQAGDIIGAWTVLHPAVTPIFSRADDNAVVLLGGFYGTRVLLLSDLGRAGQRVVLERYPHLQADIVVTGLPAQGEPVSNMFLQTVGASLLIVCDTEYPATERASRRLQERLAAQPVPVIYTRQSGALTLAVTPTGWTLRATQGPVDSTDWAQDSHHRGAAATEDL